MVKRFISWSRNLLMSLLSESTVSHFAGVHVYSFTLTLEV